MEFVGEILHGLFFTNLVNHVEGLVHLHWEGKIIGARVAAHQ